MSDFTAQFAGSCALRLVFHPDAPTSPQPLSALRRLSMTAIASPSDPAARHSLPRPKALDSVMRHGDVEARAGRSTFSALQSSMSVGIDTVIAEVLPADKSAKIADL